MRQENFLLPFPFNPGLALVDPGLNNPPQLDLNIVKNRRLVPFRIQCFDIFFPTCGYGFVRS